MVALRVSNPGTNFPNPRTYEGEQGRVKKIEGGASTTFDFAFEYLAGETAVGTAEAAIRKIQGTTTPTVHNKPQDGWCAP